MSGFGRNWQRRLARSALNVKSLFRRKRRAKDGRERPAGPKLRRRLGARFRRLHETSPWIRFSFDDGVTVVVCVVGFVVFFLFVVHWMTS